MYDYIEQCLKIPIWAFVSGTFASMLTALLLFWVKTLWLEVMIFPVFAFFFVATGALASRKGKVAVSIFLCTVACLTTFFYIGESTHPTEYYFTYLPLIAICSAAVLGVLFIIVLTSFRRLNHDI